MPLRKRLPRRSQQRTDNAGLLRHSDVGDSCVWPDVVAWIESYEVGAADLHDLRRDGSFWQNAYGYATREYDAGHRPPPPPDVTSDRRDPRL
jgi:hypothetical protein